MYKRRVKAPRVFMSGDCRLLRKFAFVEDAHALLPCMWFADRRAAPEFRSAAGTPNVASGFCALCARNPDDSSMDENTKDTSLRCPLQFDCYGLKRCRGISQ